MQAETPFITFHDNHSRQGELKMLTKAMYDYNQPYDARRRAALARRKIIAQLQDRVLNEKRAALIAATRAGDTPAANRIELQIRAHMHEEMETGV